jgi:hypothetical protein
MAPAGFRSVQTSGSDAGAVAPPDASSRSDPDCPFLAAPPRPPAARLKQGTSPRPTPRAPSWALAGTPPLSSHPGWLGPDPGPSQRPPPRGPRHTRPSRPSMPGAPAEPCFASGAQDTPDRPPLSSKNWGLDEGRRRPAESPVAAGRGGAGAEPPAPGTGTPASACRQTARPAHRPGLSLPAPRRRPATRCALSDRGPRWPTGRTARWPPA